MPESVRSLVVRCPNWVGDIVMATPVFECLRTNFPNAEISACVRPYARGILEDAPWFDHIIDCNDKSFKGLRAVCSEIKKRKPDFGLLLTNTTHSYLTFKLAGVPKIYGYKRNFRRHFLSGGPEPVRDQDGVKPLPMQDYYLELCRYLGLKTPTLPKSKLFMSSSVQQKGAELLCKYGITESDKVIGLNPGASFGSSKCWPVENFARLAELLEQESAGKILLFAGPGEDDIAQRICASSSANIINTAPDRINLSDLKPLIQRCDLLISNDTGPRHYAVAFDVPNIVLMGPTNPIYTASNLASTTVLNADLDCAPCHKKVCPLGHHACMREITADMVLGQAQRLLRHSI